MIYKSTIYKMDELKFIPRLISGHILEALKYYPVTVITGPRQSGKTVLCRHLFPDYKYLNLEKITTRNHATEDPEGFLEMAGDFAVIDEVQNVPDLLSGIQVKVDEKPDCRYILTGSSNFSLLHSITQSLAGRCALFTLLPFSLEELSSSWKEQNTDTLLFNGEYPGVVVNGIPPKTFYTNYINTYLERDVRRILKAENYLKFHSFLKLLAACAGSEVNYASLSRELGVSAPTVSGWLSILAASYIIYTLQPYYVNVPKRLTKTPKLYFYDTGLMCRLLGLKCADQIRNSHFKGALFENMAVGELLKKLLNKGDDPDLYFYREQSGKEVDVVIPDAEGIDLYEIKSSKTFNKDMIENINYLSNLVSTTTGRHIVYDGENLPPLLINIRNV